MLRANSFFSIIFSILFLSAIGGPTDAPQKSPTSAVSHSTSASQTPIAEDTPVLSSVINDAQGLGEKQHEFPNGESAAENGMAESEQQEISSQFDSFSAHGTANPGNKKFLPSFSFFHLEDSNAPTLKKCWKSCRSGKGR